MTRYDLCTGREDKDGKTRWTKIGVMFPAKSGEGFAIKLEALPLPNKDGEVWVKAFVPREREEGQEPGERPARPQNYNFGPVTQKPAKSTGAMIEDEVPF